MQTGKRYSLRQTLSWQRNALFTFFLFDTLIVILYHLFHLEWLTIPWQPISLIGIAVAFYLGFKNNSSYERLWEARKIWGGIVNASRSFTVMARDFVNNETAAREREQEELTSIRKKIVHRHVAWLHALTYHLRQKKSWEHNDQRDNYYREQYGLPYKEEQYQALQDYLSPEEYDYMMSKGNRPSHLLSLQSKDLMHLRREGVIEHFRHLEMQGLITEFYTLQGKSERIKNFPFPRQYATVNFFFVTLFIILLPLGMLDVFSNLDHTYGIIFTILFSVIGSWVFWMMEQIGDYSENPFEGLYNDVPITSMARGIEIDIRQMLDEVDLPAPVKPDEEFNVLL